jgi:hypothetical protein
MPLYKAGQEIDAWCTRCKLDLTHRIVAVVDGKPVKVECRTCYSIHMYRAPKHAPSAIAPRAASSASPTASAPPRAVARKPIPEDHMALVPPSGATIHPYRMTERFMKDQWLRHKTFGVGLVVNELGSDKIEVRFDGGTKVLVHGMAS